MCLCGALSNVLQASSLDLGDVYHVSVFHYIIRAASHTPATAPTMKTLGASRGAAPEQRKQGRKLEMNNDMIGYRIHSR